MAWAASSAPAQVSLKDVRALRRERMDQQGAVTVLYKFDPAGAEYRDPADQAALRGREAARAWGIFDRANEPVAVLARSPFGGEETPGSYWPTDVKPELLAGLQETLREAGLKPEFPDPLGKASEGGTPPALPPGKPWPKLGFAEDYEFVLVVGMHHEPIPYLGTRRTGDGKIIYARSSRVNAWAILFHAPTATAFWATTATARVGHRSVPDPLNVAAETALGYLDFDEIGTDNIPDHIQDLTAQPGLYAIDAAAMLTQTQRADAVRAVVKFATSMAAYQSSIRVLRYFNQHGAAQDFRITPEEAKRRRYTYAAQPVVARMLLVEQLRGVRSIAAASTAALVPRHQDLDIGPIGQTYAGRLPPVNADEEIILICELACSDRRGIFRRNLAGAIRNLGRCRVCLDEAMAVAKFYADRKPPAPRKGKRSRRDPLKEAGQAALRALTEAKAKQKKAPLNPPG